MELNVPSHKLVLPVANLFKAAEDKDSEQLDSLLKRGISPNVTDANGRTLLHTSLSSECSCTNCVENTESCLAILLSHTDIDLDAVDKDGRSCLHIAAENQMENCLKALVNHGANIYAVSNHGVSSLEVIAKKTPDVMCYILDRAIATEHGDLKLENCVLKVDFRSVHGSESEMELRSELKFLRSLLGCGDSVSGKIFPHPAVRIFMDRKWSLMKHQVYAGLIIYLIWLFLYTSYVIYVYVLECPCRYYTRHVNENATSPADIACSIGAGVTASMCPPLILTIILLVCNLMGTFAPGFRKQSPISELQYQSAAFTVFLAWAFTLSELGKLPSVGQYIEMLSHVLARFWSLIPAYILLIIAFAISFGILFPAEQPYAMFPFALLKVVVMTVGELEYEDTFYKDDANQTGGPLVGHFLYAVFVIVVAIVLMNLLIALTVSDVHGLQMKAEMSHVSRQIVTFHQLESFFYSKPVPRWLKYVYWKMTSVSKGGKGKMGHDFTFRPNDPEDLSLPFALKQAALERAKTHHKQCHSCPRKKHYDLSLV